MIIILLPGCSKESRDTFMNMMDIRDRLIEKYHYDRIGVSLNNWKNLVIDITNSPLNQEIEVVRKSKAQDMAETVVGLLKPDSKIENIMVVFTEHKRKYLVVNYTRHLGGYVFSVESVKKSVALNPP